MDRILSPKEYEERKTLSLEEYKAVKTEAYNLVANSSLEELSNAVRKTKIQKPESEEEANTIFKTTLFYPNDLEIIQCYNKLGGWISKISKELDIPIGIIAIKLIEINRYNLIDLLNQNKDLCRLADQAPILEPGLLNLNKK